MDRRLVQEEHSELIERLKKLEGGLETITQEIEVDYRRGLVDLDKDIRLDFERDNPVYFIDHREREIDISMLSAGEKEFLYFFAYLRRIRNDEDRIILIDEPELHLHGNQVRKLCEMLTALAEENQVIIATHSSDVLHHFLHSGNIIHLGEGVIRNINFPEDMRNLMDQIGIPIDPSVFTARWIVAENKDSKPLAGQDGPVTAEVLGWIFGKDLARRYWGFGSSRASAEGAIEVLQAATADEGDLDLTVLLDGDRQVKEAQWGGADPASVESGAQVHYLPYWELENAFLNPNLLDVVLAEEGGSAVLWQIVEDRQIELVRTISKTILKNVVTHARARNRIDRKPTEEFAALQKAVQEIELDETAVSETLNRLAAEGDWRWIPGKEVLGYLIEKCPDFWTRVRALGMGTISGHLLMGEELTSLVSRVTKED